MKPTTFAACVLIGSALSATPALAQQQAAATTAPAQVSTDPTQLKTHAPKISKEALKQVQALQTAVNGNDPAAIPPALAAAQAAAKTPEDRYYIALLQVRAAAKAKSNADVVAGLQAVLASGAAAPEELFSIYYNLGQMNSALGQSAPAAEAYQKAVDLDGSNLDAIAGLAEARAAQGRAADAVALMQHGIQLQQAGGQKAPESWYKRATAVAYKGKLDQAADLSREWLSAYPNEESWHDALLIYEQGIDMDKQQKLDFLRLKRVAGTLSDADYFDYADLALQRGFAGEAKAVLDQGVAANIIKPDATGFRDLIDIATQKSKGDRQTLPTSPAALPDAQHTLVNGDAWYGYGDYAKAAEFDKAALSKSGADANLVNLHLGMALAQAGDKAGAEAALSKVTGPNQPLAGFWMTYLSTKA